MAETDGNLRIQVNLDTKGYKAGSKELEAAARRTASTISDIGTKTKIALEKQLNAFSALNQQYARQEQKVDELKKKLEELSNQKVSTSEFKKLENEARKYQSKLQEIERTYKQLETTMQSDFTEKYGDVLEFSNEDMIETMKQNDASYKKSLVNLKKLEVEAQKYKGIIASIQADMANLESLGGSYTEADTSSVKKALAIEQEKLAQTGNRLAVSTEALEAKLKELEQQEEDTAKSAQKLQQALNNAKGSMKKISSIIGGGIRALGKFSKQSNAANNSLIKMLGTSILFSVVFRALSLVTSGIGQGFSNLAQYSDESNNAISGLVSSLEYLKNSFAVAFSPIVNVVAPIVIKFIDMLTSAANSAGAFVAALTGKGTFVKAVKVQHNYAEELNNTVKSAKGAKKILSDYLSSLDEITKFQSADDSNDSSGIGSGGITPADMFETVEIENSIVGFAQKIKELVASEDWDGLGNLFAEKINDVMAKINHAISWENVGPQILYFITAFTTSFNSLMDGIDWMLIGNTAGNGINTVIYTMLAFIEGIDWALIAASFAIGLNGVITSVDWRALGTLLRESFFALWEMLWTFVTELDWDSIGLSIMEFFDGLLGVDVIETLKPVFDWFWGEVLQPLATWTADSFLTAWNGIMEHVTNFSDWCGQNQEIISATAGVVAAFFAAWKVTELFAFIQMSGGVVGALSAIVAALFGATAAKLLDKAETIAIIGLYAKDFILSLTKGAAALVKLAAQFVINTALKVADTAAQIAMTAATVAWNTVCALATAATTAFGAAVAFLTSPIGIAVVAIAGIIAAGVLLYKNWDTISAKAAEVWKFVREKFEIFSDFVSKIFMTDWSKAFGSLGDILNAFSHNTENIWNGVKKIFSGIITFVQGVFSGDWKKAWTGVKEAFKGIFDSLVAIAKSPINLIIGLINGMLSGIFSGINKCVKAVNKLSFDVPDWVPGIGGQKFGFNLNTLSTPKIPYLASGAVIPPRSEFLAVLGDQRSGTNIETPEALLRQIMREELKALTANSQSSQNNGSYRFVAQINRRVLFDEFIQEAKMRQIQTGRNPFELA